MIDQDVQMSFSGSFFVGGLISGDDTDAETVVSQRHSMKPLLQEICCAPSKWGKRLLEKLMIEAYTALALQLQIRQQANQSICVTIWGAGTVNFSHALTDADVANGAVFLSSTAEVRPL